MRFGILGPLECPGNTCAHPPRHQKLLAALLVDAGRAVPVTELMTVMWDGWPAATARTQIQGGVSALRRHFADMPRAPRIEYGPNPRDMVQIREGTSCRRGSCSC